MFILISFIARIILTSKINRKLHLFLYDSWWHQNLIKDLFPAWSSNCMIDWVKGFVKTFNNSIFASLLFNLDNGATSNSVTNSK